MAYTTLHGTVGMLIGAIFYKLFGPIGFVISVPISFLSHLFGMDKYPEYYPDQEIDNGRLANWMDYYKLHGLRDLIIKHQGLIYTFIVILSSQFAIIACQPLFLAWALFANWLSSNLPDFTEYLLARLTHKSKFWFVHWGDFPILPERIRDFFRQHGKMTYDKSLQYEWYLNIIGLTITVLIILL